jgi:hypothetical protein
VNLYPFSLHRDEFLKRYHQWSNVESAFSMVKAKFGDTVRARADVAMRNEALAKLVCHNIACLVSGIYQLGIEPTFWGEEPEERPAILAFRKLPR